MATVTIVEAARACGVSRQTVQRDVRLGCGGVVRPGEAGRGRGALLNLDEYRAWRGGHGDERRALRVAAEAALRTWQVHGGLTAKMRQHSAFLLAMYVQRFYLQLTGCELDAAPPELLTLLNVSVSSSQSNQGSESI